MGKATKKKAKKNIAKGIVHVKATFNNTHVTITSVTGDTISWGSAGSVGFKGTRKSTPYAAQRAADQAAKETEAHTSEQHARESIRIARVTRELLKKFAAAYRAFQASFMYMHP